MMANPYFVAPASPLAALMSGVEGWEGAQKRTKEADMMAGRQEAMQALQGGGDLRSPLAKLIGIGDVKGAEAIATYAHQQSQGAHQSAALAESTRHNRATEGIQGSQVTATLEGTRVPQGFQRSPDGGLVPVTGGPADPKYLQSVADAKKGPSIEDEQKLRKEYELNNKTHLEVRRGYERLLSSKDDAAGDISLIFGYMRMLDPGSVVREGEFATAQNAAGIPDQIKNMYNRALEGTRLNPNQREMFKGQGKKLYETSTREYDARTKQFVNISKRYGFDPNNVISDIGPGPDALQQPSGAASGVVDWRTYFGGGK